MNEVDFNHLPYKVDQIYKELIELKSILQKKNKSPTEHAQCLDITGVIKYLGEQGYKLSLSTLYKFTAERKVPHSKFLGKLIFNKTDVITWAETELKKKRDERKKR